MDNGRGIDGGRGGEGHVVGEWGGDGGRGGVVMWWVDGMVMEGEVGRGGDVGRWDGDGGRDGVGW